MDVLNILMKTVFINIFSMIIFFKICNCDKINNKKKTIIFIFCVLLVWIYVFIKEKLDIVMAVFIIYVLEVILLKIMTKQNKFIISVGLIIAISTSYILLTISATIEFGLQYLFHINNTATNTILTLIIELILIFFVTKIRRIRNGLGFLEKMNEYIAIAIIDICAWLIIMYGLTRR